LARNTVLGSKGFTIAITSSTIAALASYRFEFARAWKVLNPVFSP
jgi:hypothetical protein